MSTNPTNTPGVGGSGTSGEGGPAVPGAGSGGGVIQNWIVLSAVRQPWVVSETNAIDAVRIDFQTVPHGATAAMMVPYTTFAVEGSDLIVQPVAFGMETILDTGLAVAAYGVEDTDASGLLAFFVQFVTQVAPTNPTIPGPLQSSVVVPVNQAADYTTVQGLLQAEQAKLLALPGA